MSIVAAGAGTVGVQVAAALEEAGGLRIGDPVLVITPPDGEARVHHAYSPGDPGRGAGTEGTTVEDPEAGMDG